MSAIEIIVIICIVLYLGSVIGIYAYKRITHKPTGDCAGCHARMKKAMKKACKKCQ